MQMALMRSAEHAMVHAGIGRTRFMARYVRNVVPWLRVPKWLAAMSLNHFTDQVRLHECSAVCLHAVRVVLSVFHDAGHVKCCLQYLNACSWDVCLIAGHCKLWNSLELSHSLPTA